MKELDRIIAEYEAGMYSELETYARIARLTTSQNILQIIKDLPSRYTSGFAEWIRSYPYEHEVKGTIGDPIDSFTDDLIAHYKTEFRGRDT